MAREIACDQPEQPRRAGEQQPGHHGRAVPGVGKSARQHVDRLVRKLRAGRVQTGHAREQLRPFVGGEKRKRAAQRVAGDEHLAALLACQLFGAGDRHRAVLAGRKRSARRIRRAPVARKLQQHDPRGQRRKGRDQPGHRAGRSAEPVEQQNRRPPAAAVERVAVHALAAHRGGPALRPAGDQRRVREPQHQLQRHVGNAAQCDPAAEPAQTAKRRIEPLALRTWPGPACCFPGEILLGGAQCRGPPGGGCGFSPFASGSPWPGPMMNGLYLV